MTHGSLFSGIGGFDLAAEWMGWENLFHCEWNEFGQRVLKHYWPNATSHDDITTTDFRHYAGRIDVLTGGFPCQPYSTAGKRKGKEDERHLWPQMLRAIREISPRFVVGENVRGLVTWNAGLVFDEVCADLEAQGYEVQPYLLPACAVNAPHKRDRIWFCAWRDTTDTDIAPTKHTIQTGRDVLASSLRKKGNATDTDSGRILQSGEEQQTGQPNPANQTGRLSSNPHGTGFEKRNVATEPNRSRFNTRCFAEAWAKFPSQSPVCRGNDGLSGSLDGITFPRWRNESIKAYGNAIVPQVALQIFEAIEAYES